MAPRTLLLCMVLAVAASVATAQPLQPVPGINIGVGQSFDATKITVMGLQMNPLQPVIDLTYCDPACLAPENATLPGCLYCTYSLPDYPNMTYKVPEQVMVLPYTSSSACYEQQTTATVEDYTDIVGHTVGHDGWFHSWSKTTLDFYHKYFLKDSSLSLMYKALIWHSITLPSFLAKPSLIFQLGVDALPTTYDNATYMEFIQQYGTHYMDQAHVGGLALLTNYFHSCFLEQYSGQYVYHESSSSFFGIFPLGGSSSHSGHNATSAKFKEWSEVKLKLLGGASSKYGVLTRNHTMTLADCQAWEDSIKDDMSIVKFSLQPLSTLVTDPAKAANLDRALDEYGANIAHQNQNLVNSLIPQDPKTVPSWCHYGPHPPSGDLPIQEAGGRRLSNTGTLPGCPALPSSDEVAAMAQLRELARAAA